jgi:hypothetical protein
MVLAKPALVDLFLLIHLILDICFLIWVALPEVALALDIKPLQALSWHRMGALSCGFVDRFLLAEVDPRIHTNDRRKQSGLLTSNSASASLLKLKMFKALCF